MKEGQSDIDYIIGESVAAVWSSPFLETLLKKGREVLYMTAPIDEHFAQQLKDLNGKERKSTIKRGLDPEAEFEPLTKPMKEVLGDKVEKLVVRSCMADSLCVLTTSEYDGSINHGARHESAGPQG